MLKKFNKWHQNLLFWFMEKLNLGVYQVAWISWIKGFIMGALLLLLCSCGVQLKYGTATAYSDGIYEDKVILEVPANISIDTLSYSQFRWKLRTDFNFRWDYAQYAINQPYNWYFNNFRYNYWRPYNSFDFYWNRYSYWTDWAYNYPYYWGYSSWHNPWRNYWYRPYNWGYSWYNGPWHNQGYNVVWNSSRRNNNIAYINGRRGSKNFTINNNNIENTIVRRYNNPRVNVDNSNLNNIVNELRENYNIKPRIINNNSNNINNNNIRPNYNINNSKPSYNNNNFNFNNSSKPTYNSRPSISNSTRSSNSTSIRGNSKGRN